MSLKFMDPQAIENLLAQHPDVLTPLVEKEREYLRGLRCPQCSSDLFIQQITAERPFVQSSSLPNFHCQCSDCGCVFAPYSGLIISG